MSKNEPKEEKTPVDEKKTEPKKEGTKKAEKKEVAKETAKAEESKAEKETKSESKQEVKEEIKKEIKETPKNEIANEVKKEKIEEKTEVKANDNKKRTGKKKLIAIAVVLLAAIVALVVWLVLGRTKTIDLAECLEIKYNGYSGHATATVKIDDKKLKSKLDDKVSAKKFIEKTELEIENNTDLSNGDELVVKVKISSNFLEENKIKIKDTTMKIKIEGIEEAIEIDMEKYIDVTYKGFNKHATAEVKFNPDKIEDDLGYNVSSKFVNRINFEIKNNGNLSNDDELEIKVMINESYLEEIGLTLKSDIVKIKVEGLKDATEIDAFKDIKIDLSGMSPNLSISISNNSEDKYAKTIEYKASKTSGIANGEKITITAVRWDEELFEEDSIALNKTTMEYTVSGQSAYIFSKSEINDTVKGELKTIFVSKATSKANENHIAYNSDNLKYQLKQYTDYKYADVDNYEATDRDLTFGTPEVMSTYLLTKKDDKASYNINMIIGIVKIPCKSAKTGATYNWYVTVKAKNAYLNTDGTISDNTNYTIEVNDGKDEESAYQKHINSEKNNYNVEKISL